MMNTLAVMALIGAGMLSPFRTGDGQNLQKIKKVRVEPVTVSKTSRKLRYSGNLRAARQATLAFTIEGRLLKRQVDIGDGVSQGQVLAQLEEGEYLNAKASGEAALARLRSQIEQTQRDLQRIQRLLDAKSATPEQLEHLQSTLLAQEASHREAQARLDEAARLLRETKLVAPFNGIVSAIHLEPGEFAIPGRPVLAITGSKDLEMHVEVPESTVSHLRQGARVSLHLPLAQSQVVEGTIKSIGRATQGSGKLFPVVVALEPQSNLFPGMTAELMLDLSDTQQITVPLTAIINPGGGDLPALFRVRNNIAERVFVRVGSLQGSQVSVEGDLTPEDRVVVSGLAGLISGARVEVLK